MRGKRSARGSRLYIGTSDSRKGLATLASSLSRMVEQGRLDIADPLLAARELAGLFR